MAVSQREREREGLQEQLVAQKVSALKKQAVAAGAVLTFSATIQPPYDHHTVY
jgi:hypothetical protein